jgi:hypothetical protein
VNGSGNITPEDAQMAFRYYIDCPGENPTHDEYCAADFCGEGEVQPCDGAVTPGDALGILKEYLGYPNPCARGALAGGFDADTISVTSAAGCTGDTIQVAVNIENGDTPVDAFGFHFVYDPRMLAYQDCSLGSLNPDWMFFDCREDTPGEVIIGGFDLDPIPAGSSGSIAVLTFQVVCTDCVEGEFSFLNVTELVDDIAGFTPTNGVFMFQCEGTPTGTPIVSPTAPPTWTPRPTDTAAPPTRTPVPPSATPAPPTKTPTSAPPTKTPTPGATATAEPTKVPSVTPPPTPVESPVATPTKVPSPTPTPAITAPPATFTPAPGTGTPTPIPPLGVELEMPSDYFRPGDICWLNAHVHNPGDPIPDTPLVVMLDIGTGDFWFWPSWAHYPPDIDYAIIEVAHGTSTYPIIGEFVWPSEVGSMNGLIFWGALLNQDLTEVVGEFGYWVFGYGY